jgi:hypothetical protein
VLTLVSAEVQVFTVAVFDLIELFWLMHFHQFTIEIEARVYHCMCIREVPALARLHHLCKAPHVILHFNFEDIWGQFWWAPVCLRMVGVSI